MSKWVDGEYYDEDNVMDKKEGNGVLSGAMENNIKASGRTENSMAREMYHLCGED